MASYWPMRVPGATSIVWTSWPSLPDALDGGGVGVSVRARGGRSSPAPTSTRRSVAITAGMSVRTEADDFAWTVFSSGPDFTLGSARPSLSIDIGSSHFSSSIGASLFDTRAMSVSRNAATLVGWNANSVITSPVAGLTWAAIPRRA